MSGFKHPIFLAINYSTYFSANWEIALDGLTMYIVGAPDDARSGVHSIFGATMSTSLSYDSSSVTSFGLPSIFVGFRVDRFPLWPWWDFIYVAFNLNTNGGPGNCKFKLSAYTGQFSEVDLTGWINIIGDSVPEVIMNMSVGDDKGGGLVDVTYNIQVPDPNYSLSINYVLTDYPPLTPTETWDHNLFSFPPSYGNIVFTKDWLTIPWSGYVPPFSISNPRYWVANTDSTWADTTNWSNTSGGPGGYSIPDIQNVVIFDNNGSGNCDIDATVDVQGLALNGYTGMVRQNGYDMQMDTTGALFWTGDFSGDGGDIRVRGNLDIGGAINFLSTDQTLSCDSTFTYYHTGTFNHNNGVISLDNSGCMIDGSGIVDGSGMVTSALQFNTPQARVGEDFYVNRLLVLNSGSARHVNANRNLIVRGDVSCRSGYDQWTDFNKLSILLDSTEQQSITNEIGCILPTLSVNKDTTNQVVCYGESPLRIKGDFALNDGTFNTNSLSVQVGY